MTCDARRTMMLFQRGRSPMRPPTMTVEGCVLLRRLTLIVQERRVVAAFYPVFPPDEAPNQVLAWLTERNERMEPTKEHR